MLKGVLDMKKICLCFSVCVGLSASVVYEVSSVSAVYTEHDVSVYFYKDGGKQPLLAGVLREIPLSVDCGRGAEKVCDVLREQALAGSFFHPEVSSNFWHCPALWRDEVRTVACSSRVFFSEEIQKCLQKIDEVFGLKKEGVAQGSVYNDMYPEGKTRAWWPLSRGELKKRAKKGDIHIVFRGVESALRGVLCPEEDVKPVSSMSVLRIKRRAEGKPRPAFFTPLERCFASTKCGVGLVYYPEDGGQVRAMFDLYGVRFDDEFVVDSILCRRGVSLFHHIRDQILFGYILYRYVKNIDVESFRDPAVLEALCHKEGFLSIVLRDVVQNVLKDFWRQKKYTVSAERWSDFTQQHFEALCGQYGTLVWNLVDSGETLTRVEEGLLVDAPSPGTLFLLIQGEHVSFEGRPFDAPGRNERAAPPGSVAYYQQQELTESTRKTIKLLKKSGQKIRKNSKNAVDV